MKKIKLSPIFSFIILIIITIILSGILSFFNVQAEYSTISKITNEVTNNVVEVNNLFSGSGLKFIVTNAVSNFVSFTPFSMLIITLIGIGVLEASGFNKTFFTLLTKNSSKYTLTFLLVLFSIIFSLLGDIMFAVMLPIGALLFKYGRRNPLGGIIASFASISFGYGVNLFLSATDSSLLNLTLKAARILDTGYTIGLFFTLFVMILVTIVMSFIFTQITEKNIMQKLQKIEYEDDGFRITKKELRALITAIGVAILYVLVILYMVIPGLPLSGALLDASQKNYIDMLLGSNSLFNQGFVFIITFLFILMGLFYGIVTKKIKNNKDLTESFAFSLDQIGNIIVLIFFFSLFVGIFEKSNIGSVITAGLVTLTSKFGFTGIGLVISVLVVIMISNIFMPNTIAKWSLLSATIVPLFMNASLSPELSQIVFVAGDSITNGITPLLVYFVIYIAFLEKYSPNHSITLKESIKYMVPYSIASFIIWFIILSSWCLAGIPLGISSFPSITYSV